MQTLHFALLPFLPNLLQEALQFNNWKQKLILILFFLGTFFWLDDLIFCTESEWAQYSRINGFYSPIIAKLHGSIWGAQLIFPSLLSIFIVIFAYRRLFFAARPQEASKLR